jgi:hypothetical protein
MALSMAVRFILAAALLLAVAACGRQEPASPELRLLAPADLVEDLPTFERSSGCRVDLRVYDEAEDLAAIAKRRDVDVVAAPPAAGTQPHDSVELVRITLEPGLELTVPRRFASAFEAPARPAGRRSTRWTIRNDGDNPACARQWVAYATSQ